jgi:hypothetical protein
MKTTWHGVNAEFYEYGKVLACKIGRQAKAKPNNQYKKDYGKTSFILWLTSEERADELLAMIKSGEVYIDDLISFYKDCLPLEGRAA